MSATNATANYELPIFLATDKPAWLTDWNGAMNAIDTAIHGAQSTADGAQTTAGACVADIATINASLTTITGNITSLTTAVNGNTGAINTINSLIGNGQPTTEDKTIIGAINEIYARNGYVFKDSSLKSYYMSKAWYYPDSSFTTSDFSSVESYNIKLLEDYS